MLPYVGIRGLVSTYSPGHLGVITYCSTSLIVVLATVCTLYTFVGQTLLHLHLSSSLPEAMFKQLLRRVPTKSLRSTKLFPSRSQLLVRPQFQITVRLASTMQTNMETKTFQTASPQHFMHTEGATSSVWSLANPYNDRPRFSKLNKNLETDVVIVGSGMAGISTAFDLVKRGHHVVMLEAREVLSGETDRTSGHLATALDDGYLSIKEKHGDKGAAVSFESHQYAADRVGEIATELGIDCEYRHLDSYDISQYRRSDKEFAEEMKTLKEEAAYQKSLGMPTDFDEKLAVPGWTGGIDQRGGLLVRNQATFHPTKYLLGVLAWLQKQPNFSCFTHSRVMDTKEKGGVLGIGNKYVQVHTEDGHTVSCNDVVMATCVPLQGLSVIAEMEYMRTYCVAMRIPKGSYTDALVYDTAEIYHYVRFTACDEKDDYLVVGGGDHKVGQAGDEKTRFAELENWVRERYTQVGAVDYQWSGQVFEPLDHVAFIGLDPGTKHTYIITGDSGNGLTHAVLGAKIVADEIEGKQNPWSEVYNPKRTSSLIKSAKDILAHDLQINSQFKRWLQSDITDIEDLAPGHGGVLNAKLSKPIAVYKTEDGEVRKLSAVCPHLKGMLMCVSCICTALAHTIQVSCAGTRPRQAGTARFMVADSARMVFACLGLRRAISLRKTPRQRGPWSRL